MKKLFLALLCILSSTHITHTMKRKSDDVVEHVTKKQKTDDLTWLKHGEVPQKEGYFYKPLACHADSDTHLHYALNTKDTQPGDPTPHSLAITTPQKKFVFNTHPNLGMLFTSGFNDNGSMLAFRITDDEPIHTYVINTTTGEHTIIDSKYPFALNFYNNMLVDTREEKLHIDGTNTDVVCKAKDSQETFTQICVQNNIVAALYTDVVAPDRNMLGKKQDVNKLLLYNILLKEKLDKNLGTNDYSQMTIRGDNTNIYILGGSTSAYARQRTLTTINNITPTTPNPCIFSDKNSNFKKLPQELHQLIWYKIAQLHWQNIKDQPLTTTDTLLKHDFWAHTNGFTHYDEHNGNYEFFDKNEKRVTSIKRKPNSIISSDGNTILEWDDSGIITKQNLCTKQKR